MSSDMVKARSKQPAKQRVRARTPVAKQSKKTAEFPSTPAGIRLCEGWAWGSYPAASLGHSMCCYVLFVAMCSCVLIVCLRVLNFFVQAESSQGMSCAGSG